MAAKVKKDYSIVKQGIEQLYPKDESIETTVDIVAVPGLGAHPVESWQYKNGDFNWLSHPEGLPSTFPKARVLLFDYESIWKGGLKVQQFIKNLGMTLLTALKSARKDKPRKPIVFIGHSMGGLVIAKAVCCAVDYKEHFPEMYEAIAGCVFFGTPFEGAKVAFAGVMYAALGQYLDQTKASKLLELMEEGNDQLRELKNDFMRHAQKGKYSIDVVCFFEQRETDFAELLRLSNLPFMTSLFSGVIPKGYRDYVTADSASLEGLLSLGLNRTHRDLVKFDGPKDTTYKTMRELLRKVVTSAPWLTKNRYASIRDVDRKLVHALGKAFNTGTSPSKRRKDMDKNIASHSFLLQESEYASWSAPGETNIPCLWLYGPEGKGKGSAVVAVTKDLESKMSDLEQSESGDSSMLLAYYFCDTSAEGSNAEELLKSILWQLIDQQESLAAYAKQFVSKPEGGTDNKVHTSVENLWQCLQQMLSDDFVGTVYIAIHNLHTLTEHDDTTKRFMLTLSEELSALAATPDRRRKCRWFFTSRRQENIRAVLDRPLTHAMNLEDDRFRNQLDRELRLHAKSKVEDLGKKKQYNKTLRYLAEGMLGEKAGNSKWIDVTCVRLGYLPNDATYLTVRGVLDSVPQDLDIMLTHLWTTVFSNNLDANKIKEMLRVLISTADDPTVSELVLLTEMDDSDQGNEELNILIDACRPLLETTKSGREFAKVRFVNKEVKLHLDTHREDLLGLSEQEQRLQHGLLAWRCFDHVVEHFKQVQAREANKDESNVDGIGSEGQKTAADASNEDAVGDETKAGADNHDDAVGQEDDGRQTDTADARQDDVDNDDNGNDEDETDEDENDDDDNNNVDNDDQADQQWWSDEYDSEEYDDEVPQEETDQPEKPDVHTYAIKWWLHHASKATAEMAEMLSREDEFWSADTPRLRDLWLEAYNQETDVFFTLVDLKALHVVASIGYPALVRCLIENGHAAELSQLDKLFSTPLHLAAWQGRDEIVEELLQRESEVDHGKVTHNATPLGMAAGRGHIKVMDKLLTKHADIDAIDTHLGPVINEAIFSGTKDAVQMLVERGAKLDVVCEYGPPPLVAAVYGEYGLFKYMLEACEGKVDDDHFGQAVVSASGEGKIDHLNLLLGRCEYRDDVLQDALDMAAIEENWDIVLCLLGVRAGLNCSEAFKEAATCMDPPTNILETLWEYSGQRISQEAISSSLYSASDNEQLAILQLLLEYGADPEAKGDVYGNALTAAAFDGTLDIVRALLEKGATVNSPNGWPLAAAVEQNHENVVRLLLQQPEIDVNAFNERFEHGTALQAACEQGWAPLVELLLSHHADPNLEAKSTRPIIAATRNGDREILQDLLSAGADVNVMGGITTPSTPLILASGSMEPESLQALVDHGADINTQDAEGDTALIYAASVGDEENVEFLLKQGADVTCINNQGKSAIDEAFDEDNRDCFKLLLEQVSKVLKALKQAVDDGNKPVIQVLENAGIKRQVALKRTEGGAVFPTQLKGIEALASLTNGEEGEQEDDAVAEANDQNPEDTAAGAEEQDGSQTMVDSDGNDDDNQNGDEVEAGDAEIETAADRDDGEESEDEQGEQDDHISRWKSKARNLFS